jgi:ferritin
MNEARLIESVLESLREAHTQIDKSIENLIEVQGFKEDDFLELKANTKKLYKLNSDIQEFLVASLSDEFNSEKVKKSLINLSLMNSIKRDTDRKSMLEWFVEEKLGKTNG